MSQSRFFKELQEEGLITGSNGTYVDANGDTYKADVSLRHTLNILKRMDSRALMGRYVPSEYELAMLEKKYGQRGNIPEGINPAERIRYLTPFMHVSGEGAFFIIHGYGWKRGKRARAELVDQTVIAHHPDASLIKKAMIGEIDPKDGQPWSLSKIQADPDCVDIAEIKPEEGLPQDIIALEDKLANAERSVYETDMNDRIVAQIHHSKKRDLIEWRNRNIYYYTKECGKDECGQRLYDIFMMSSGGKADDHYFDDRNKWIRRLAVLGLVNRIKVASAVTEEDANAVVERDFVDAAHYLVQGGDPYYEKKLLRDMERNKDKPKKLKKLEKRYHSKMPRFRPRQVLTSFMLNWMSEEGSEISTRGIATQAFRRGAMKAASQTGKMLFRGVTYVARHPAAARVYLIAGAALVTGRSLSKGAEGENISEMLSSVNSEIQLALALAVPFAALGLWEAMQRHVRRTPESLEYDMHKRVAQIGPRMHPDFGRYPIRSEFLQEAQFAFDYQVDFDDLQEPESDVRSEQSWHQFHLLEDYTPLSIPHGSTVKEISIGEHKAVLAEGPSGYKRIFIPSINMVFQWFEERDVVQNALPVSEYLQSKFNGLDKESVFVIANRGYAPPRYDEHDVLQNPVLVSHKISRDEMKKILGHIKELPNHRQTTQRESVFRAKDMGDIFHVEPQYKDASLLFGLIKRRVFDVNATYPDPECPTVNGPCAQKDGPK